MNIKIPNPLSGMTFQAQVVSISLVVGAVIFSIAILMLLGYVDSCGDRRTEKKLEKLGANANTAANNSLVIQGQITEENKQLQNSVEERTNANEKVNSSLSNLNAVRNSRVSNTNRADLRKHLCELYPDDCK